MSSHSNSSLSQVGSSSTLYNDPKQVKDTYFMYGAPGKDTWEGGAYVNENLDDTGLPKVRFQSRKKKRHRLLFLNMLFSSSV